jgi:hypothetical protein
MPAGLERRLGAFDGFKILFLQDEYDHTNLVRGWITALGIGCVFTCVPEQHIDAVYPASRFPGVDFRTTFTGYVPINAHRADVPPLSERPVTVGYRGRALHPRYGNLAREKFLIGERMRAICAERGIPADIESSEDKRIYGKDWYSFLANCRATLGTESGSNVFDEDGTLRATIDEAHQLEPQLSYEATHARFIGERDGPIQMNQISPRIFEAIATRTALILFEGDYSGVVSAWKHYLPLRKDFGNIDEILLKLEDLPELEMMTTRAYDDVIKSGKFSYSEFVHDFDTYVASRLKPKGRTFLSVVVAALPSDDRMPSLDVAPCSATNLPIAASWIVHRGPRGGLPSAIRLGGGVVRRARSFLARVLG